ncbi:hypothetical protein D3C80_2030060 [compost metagenome]
MKEVGEQDQFFAAFLDDPVALVGRQAGAQCNTCDRSCCSRRGAGERNEQAAAQASLHDVLGMAAIRNLALNVVKNRLDAAAKKIAGHGVR